MKNGHQVQAKGKNSIIVQTKMGPKFFRDILLVPGLSRICCVSYNLYGIVT